MPSLRASAFISAIQFAALPAAPSAKHDAASLAETVVMPCSSISTVTCSPAFRRMLVPRPLQARPISGLTVMVCSGLSCPAAISSNAT